MDLKTYFKSFINGGIAGVIGKTLVAPFDRVKYIFITTSRSFTYKAAMSEVRDIIQTTGFLKLWRGNFFNILRIFPYAAIVK